MPRSLYGKSESTTPELSERMQALSAAVNARGEYVIGYLMSLTRDAHTAKDLAQQTWLKVYEYFEVNDFTHLGLLKHRAHQVFIDYARARTTRAFVQTHENLDNFRVEYIPREQEGAEAEAILKARFWENFAPLKFEVADRECFWLLYRYGYTIKEVSERLKWPTTTIHDRMRKLKQACVQRLQAGAQ